MASGTGEFQSQVYHGNDLAAEVDHALQMRRSAGHGGNILYAHDLFADVRHLDAELFFIETEYVRYLPARVWATEGRKGGVGVWACAVIQEQDRRELRETLAQWVAQRRARRSRKREAARRSAAFRAADSAILPATRARRRM